MCATHISRLCNKNHLEYNRYFSFYYANCWHIDYCCCTIFNTIYPKEFLMQHNYIMGCYFSLEHKEKFRDHRNQNIVPKNLNCQIAAFSLTNSSSSTPKQDLVTSMLNCCNHESTEGSIISDQNQVNETEVDLSHFLVGKDVLGLGGFGIVRKVTKLTGSDDGKEYALKSMSKGMVLARNTGCMAVMTELKTLIMVDDCEFICRLHYAFQDDSNLYMVLDYAPCGDLRYNIRLAPMLRFSEALSRIFTYQILSALNHCHRRSILHRDVKPENILLYSSGCVKLSDFGVAKILPDIEKCRSTSGTHGYMAPEIYAGDHTHGTPFDWFCSGITLHELLTGRRPFEAAKLQKYFSFDPPQDEQLQLDYLYRHHNLSAACKDFVAKLLTPQPQLRLGSCGGFDAILSHIWFHDLSLFDGTVRQLMKSELPHIFSNTINDKGSKLNIGKDEAYQLIKRHQEAHTISADVQEIFKKFTLPSRSSSQRISLSRLTTSLHRLASPRYSVDSREEHFDNNSTERIVESNVEERLNIFSRGSDNAPVVAHKSINCEENDQSDI